MPDHIEETPRQPKGNFHMTFSDLSLLEAPRGSNFKKYFGAFLRVSRRMTNMRQTVDFDCRSKYLGRAAARRPRTRVGPNTNLRVDNL